MESLLPIQVSNVSHVCVCGGGVGVSVGFGGGSGILIVDN